MKKIRLLEIIHEEITSALTEIPDFGGRILSERVIHSLNDISTFDIFFLSF